MAGPAHDVCDAYRDPAFLQLAVSILILVGLLISYLPQHYRIISRGTSEGISPYFVLLGTTSATSGFANILLLAESRRAADCCKELETFECAAGLLGIAQLGAQWICFVFILLLFLVFFRYTTAAVPDEELPSPATQPRWQTALFVAATCLVHGLLIIVLTSLFQSVWASQMPAWANFLGVMAAALAAVQYLPQIWTTYHLKHVGSLSIPMMIIQTPGGLLFAGSLFARLGWGGWSSWGIFLLSALMQGILLGLAIYYEIERRAEVDEDGSHTTSRPEGEDETLAPPHDTNGQVDEAGRNERAPLLKSSNNGNAHRSYDTNQG